MLVGTFNRDSNERSIVLRVALVAILSVLAYFVYITCDSQDNRFAAQFRNRAV